MLLFMIAMAPAPGGGGQGGAGIAAFLPIILIFVIFYFLILRPQAKKQKEHEKMLSELVTGDHVVTTGGLHGVVQRVNEKEGTVVLRIADGVKIDVDRAAIGRKIVRSTEE
jgi:preprotein translocase subunit YajC